jgi:hypothetical protein
MKHIKKILFVGMIGVMMATGLVLVGCEQENCPRTADCRSELNSAGETDSYAQHCSSNRCSVVKDTEGKGITCDC